MKHKSERTKPSRVCSINAIHDGSNAWHFGNRAGHIHHHESYEWRYCRCRIRLLKILPRREMLPRYRKCGPMRCRWRCVYCKNPPGELQPTGILTQSNIMSTLVALVTTGEDISCNPMPLQSCSSFSCSPGLGLLLNVFRFKTQATFYSFISLPRSSRSVCS